MMGMENKLMLLANRKLNILFLLHLLLNNDNDGDDDDDYC